MIFIIILAVGLYKG